MNTGNVDKSFHNHRNTLEYRIEGGGYCWGVAKIALKNNNWGLEQMGVENITWILRRTTCKD